MKDKPVRAVNKEDMLAKIMESGKTGAPQASGARPTRGQTLQPTKRQPASDGVQTAGSLFSKSKKDRLVKSPKTPKTKYVTI